MTGLQGKPFPRYKYKPKRVVGLTLSTWQIDFGSLCGHWGIFCWFSMVKRNQIVKPKLAKRALQINICSGFVFSPLTKKNKYNIEKLFAFIFLFVFKQVIKPFYTSTDPTN